MAHHNLKIKTKYYIDIILKGKRFEIRKNDRGYKVGDMCLLRPDCDKFPPLQILIDYISDYEQKDNYIVFSFRCISIETVLMISDDILGAWRTKFADHITKNSECNLTEALNMSWASLEMIDYDITECPIECANEEMICWQD